MDDKELLAILNARRELLELTVPALKNRDLYDNFIIEVVELAEAFFRPIPHGISRHAIGELLRQEVSLCDYLHAQRYVVVEQDFRDVIYKYMREEGSIETRCVTLCISRRWTEERVTNMLRSTIEALISDSDTSQLLGPISHVRLPRS